MSLNFSFDNLIHANLISFIVMVSIITFACKKLKVGNAFENLRNKIKTEVDNSEKAKQDSIQALDDIKNELKVLPQRLDDLENEAKETAKTLVKNIEDDTVAKKDIIHSNMETALDYHVKMANEKLSKDISIASIALAKDNFVQMLKNNPDLQYKILKECMEKL